MAAPCTPTPGGELCEFSRRTDERTDGRGFEERFRENTAVFVVSGGDVGNKGFLAQLLGAGRNERRDSRAFTTDETVGKIKNKQPSSARSREQWCSQNYTKEWTGNT